MFYPSVLFQFIQINNALTEADLVFLATPEYTALRCTLYNDNNYTEHTKKRLYAHVFNEHTLITCSLLAIYLPNEYLS